MPEIVMPQLGESVTEGTITRWFKSVGDTVTEDEPLFEVSTDKVDTEVPSPESGVLSEIRVEEGDTVDVGTVLAVVGGPAAAPSAEPVATQPAHAPESSSPVEAERAEATPTVPAEAPPTAPAEVQPAVPAQATPSAPTPAPLSGPPPAPVRETAQPTGRAEQGSAPAGLLLSPMVRRLVEDNGLDAASITGTGVGGRITREDVLDALDAGAAQADAADARAPRSQAHVAAANHARPQPVARPSQTPPRPLAPQVAPMRHGVGDIVEPLNRIRRMTGELMLASRATSPHVITAVEVDYSAVERARLPRRDAFRDETGFSLTYLPFIVRAVVDSLREFPHMNASMGEGQVVLHNDVHMGIAVDLNYEGLLAPVVRDAHEKRLRAIADDINDLAERARSKQLSPDELSGGTFTISNSGAYGSMLVAPIINQPQVAILSTDGVSRKPVVVADEFGNESIAVHSIGVLTLCWDHRAFDGAYAASFMSKVREVMETRDWSVEF